MKSKFRYTPSQYDHDTMLFTKKNILHGKRWWRFYEAQFYFSLAFLTPLIGCLLRIAKVGIEYPLEFLMLLLPPIFIFSMFYYRQSELKFITIENNYSCKQNQLMIKQAVKELKWKISNCTENHVEAITNSSIGFTWGNEMVTIIFDEHIILINCQCNLDYYKTQGFFTFGKLTRLSNILKHQIESQLPSKNADDD